LVRPSGRGRIYPWIPKSRYIKLSVKDEILVDRFIKFVGADAKNKRYRAYVGGSGRSVAINIFDKAFSKHIRNKGIVSPKCQNLSLPAFSDEALTLAYLMGYYDGDGNARDPVLNSGSMRFLKQVKRKFNIETAITTSINKHGSCFRLALGRSLILRLLENYKKSLSRKREGLLNINPSPGAKNYCNCGRPKARQAVGCMQCYRLRSLKPLDLALVKVLLQRGNSLTNISVRLGFSANGIKKRLKALGLYELSAFCHGNRQNIKLEILRLYKEGLNTSEIQSQTDVSKSTIRRAIAEYRSKHRSRS
jgi:hypothetical protein